MEFAYALDGGSAPYVKRYQTGEAMLLAGIPVVKPTLIDTSGLLKASTTAAVDFVGVTIDVPPARQTAQNADAKLEALVSVIVNPFAVYKGRLAGGAAAGTQLSLYTNTVASTTGALITAAAIDAAYDDGYAFGYDGANAGLLRKSKDRAATTVAFVIAFDHDIAVGDNFLMSSFGPGEINGVGLCTELTEIDATLDNQGGTDSRCVEINFRTKSSSGRTQSYAYIVFTDSLFIA